ncbi:MAG: endopeptidase La [Ruminococcus sp.]|nr:endopeptidase La [Ruminococcus sp.]
MTNKTDIKEKNIMPFVPTRDLVVFPDMTMHFDVGRAKSVKSIKNAMSSDGLVFLSAQKNVNDEEPGKDDLFKIGTVAVVKQIVKIPGGVYRCLVQGVQKARLIDVYEYDDCYEAMVKRVQNYTREKLNANEQLAVFREVMNAFETYAEYLPKMPQELYNQILGSKTLIQLFEGIAFNVPMPFVDRQALLEAGSAGEKLVALMTMLARELEVAKIEHDIHQQVHAQIEDNQREYYIREQIKALKGEIGEEDDTDEVSQYYAKIDELPLPEETADKLKKEVRRLSKVGMMSQEGSVIRTYLDTVLELPWGSYSVETADIKLAKKILDEDHYGLAKVKDRILENLAVRELAPNVKGQIICLVGPPGVGKTSVAKSVARALDRQFVRVSLGGVKDESDIRGHRKTYVGAMPGRIINAMRLAKTSNPVILLDEIDKMSNDYRGDPSSAMLEVLDSEQNNAFRDHYIEVPFDLSEVLFITTANTLDTVQAPLLDRMEVIELSSYTREEKFHIAKDHLIKKQLKKHGLNGNMVRFNKDAVYRLIDSYTREAGVRKLERAIASLCRKAAKEIIEDEVTRVTFKGKELEKYLGHPKYLDDYFSKKDAVGIVNGLAWTAVGGVVMPLEVMVLEGKGKVELTGSLGDVMKESAKIAVSYCRSVADKYDINKEFYEKNDIHVHAPEGAVPKDGPSAGVTMITGLISALSGLKVRADVAMTGEITLSGKVLPIGGLREKTMAAYKAGIKKVIIPYANKPDLDEVDDAVKLGLEFVFAQTIEDVLEHALIDDRKEKIPLELLEQGKPRRRKLTV